MTKRRREQSVESEEHQEEVGFVRNAQDALEKVRSGLQCGICMELLDRPCVVSPCGHIFCAKCLVQWFGVELRMDQDEEQNNLVRRKKVCPSCRTQVMSPPVELWALKSIVDAVRRADDPTEAKSIPKDCWKGLFDPSTFYHVIRDQEDGVLRCGACASEILEGQCTNPAWYVLKLAYKSAIVYEDMTDDEQDWHRSEAVDADSNDDVNDSDDDDAGSLEDFVVNDDEDQLEVSSESGTFQSSQRSSDSGIQSISPPAKSQRAPSNTTSHAASASNVRRDRLNALLASRAQRRGSHIHVDDEVSDDIESASVSDSDASQDSSRTLSSDIAALDDSDEADSDL
ncbi:E3 ubiquitin ligase [Malassezia psittaci]|uniref:E3 ubiquitin ligase n=1 Tax=Malassezia psittaci TaxID=1821823 RepID=A0AAF0JFU8_9BASI|nr:E3 ubiquitin ligase [Malassezia psittaci]